jgi:transposase-like protein
MDTEEKNIQDYMPAAEEVAAELSKAKSIDDFFGKEGIFSRLFAKTLEQMMEAELSEQLGYEKYEAKGRNSGNSRNGYYERNLKTSTGEMAIQVPRDRNGEFESKILDKHASNTNELEKKITWMYAKGMSVRDIQDTLEELYGVELSPSSISVVTNKVWELVETWQNRPLSSSYPLVWLDAIHIKIRRNHKVDNTAVYIILGVDWEGKKDVLGHWIGDGGESAAFWMNVLSDLQGRGVEEILIASMDGLSGFSEAVEAVFPGTIIQKCVIHQIRNSLKYLASSDYKPFMADLKKVYQAPNLEKAAAELENLDRQWGEQYPLILRSWRKHWDELTAYFQFPAEIRRLIYTTNTVEGYNRQIRKVIKTKGGFPNPEAVRKILYLATVDITEKWNTPIFSWRKIYNQLMIYFNRD